MIFISNIRLVVLKGNNNSYKKMTGKVELMTYCTFNKIFFVNFYFYFQVNNIYIWKTINVIIGNNLLAIFLFS